MERTMRAIQRFVQTAKELHCQEVLAVATSAAREAKNRAAFLDRARREAGIDLVVISGEVEATLTALGVAHALGPGHGDMLIVDIGGGSTEFTAYEQGRVTGYVSLPIGVVKLTEAHLKDDPPSTDELDSVATSIRQTIRHVPASVNIPPAATLVATAGTATTLAAIDLGMTTYDGGRVTGHRLSRQRIQELLDRFCSLPLAERRKIVGLEPARADVIVAGTLLMREILDLFGFDEFTVSDGGLREGILLHHLTHRHESKK
jgi:exopolyphosphatase/guanosine-5'-triphosphate,3'-diphosphate pyrophosphatase